MNTLFGIKGMIETHGYSNAFFIIQRALNMPEMHWILRDKAGNYIDSGDSRLALAQRNNLELREI